MEVGDRPINDADCTIISDYTDALSVARDPEDAAAHAAVMAERRGTGVANARQAFCPYCGRADNPGDFMTKQQICRSLGIR